ncbi:sodium:solute symporter family protein [Desertibacillus haloalkaliphilus]|uniref:sodium:solute symporter family protein n=1 Tax=Desertibacillus haloalkaliphilus TaxID=1328930 RepID=UPI001C28064F|nr:sodium:solute symporter family protein [Desertibacillus haloalkaliphilus]MBU8906941.1 sodium:solute symporter family protein [Desertibacillus haloalkaliphilus]
MKTVELSIMIIYLLFLIGLGLYSQRRISNSGSGVDDYYVAGRSIGTGVNSLAMLAALGSGGSFMAGAGTIWNLGFPFLAWMTVGSIVGFAISSILVAKPLRQSRKFTVSEFINDRYGGAFFKMAIPIVIIIGSAMYLMSQMTAGGLIASYVTGLTYEWGLIIIVLVFIFYVSLGGMLAVTWTNVLQGAMMVFLIAAIIFGAITNLPMPWSEFVVSATNENPALGAVGVTVPIAAYIGAFVTWAAAVCVTPHLVMRIFTATDVRSAKLSLNISMLIYGLLMLGAALIIVPFIPLLGTSVLESHASDMWMLLIADQFFGPVVMGIITAGIMAAVMSSTDALLLAVSSAFAYDLYKGVINPKASQKKILRVSMMFTWVIGIVVMLLTLNPPAFLIVLYTAAVGFMVSALFSPLVLGIWWKRANRTGAIAGLVVGATSFFVSFFVLTLPYNSEILVSLPLSLITMMVVSKLTEQPSQEMIDKMKDYHSDPSLS